MKNLNYNIRETSSMDKYKMTFRSVIYIGSLVQFSFQVLDEMHL